MEIRQLKYFAALAKYQNFTKAAQELYISQPTLSQQISALETSLGCSLFYRSKRMVALTAAGEALLPKAEQLIEYYNQCLDELDIYRTASKGSVNLSTLNHAETTFLFEFLHLFHLKYPNIKINIQSANSFTELMNRIINKENTDVTINLLSENQRYPNMDILRIPTDGNDRLSLIISKNSVFANINSFDEPKLSDLFKKTCFLYNGWHSYEKPLELIHKYNPDAKIVYYDNVHEFFFQNLKQDGYTILPEIYFYNVEGNKWCHSIPLPDDYGKLTLTLNYHKKSSNPCLAVFIKEMENYWHLAKKGNAFVS